ncbi:MAG: DUF1573 domain-containing protein [Verrucomicrobiota bacterium]
MKSLLLVPGLLALAASSSLAQLTFPETEVEKSMEASEDSTTVTFILENKSEAEIQIEGVKTSCGCLVAKTDKDSYAPGESGEVTAVFKVGNATGEVRKYVNVSSSTSGEKHPTQRLGVKISIPEIISIEPKMLEWSTGEEITAKTFTVSIDFESPIHIVAVNSSREQFGHTLTTIEEGKKYEIAVTPEDTSSPMLGFLNIETDAPVDKLKKKLAFYSIKRPRPRRAEPVSGS